MSIQKITSRRIELPVIFLIENEDDFKQLPKGIPFILANKSELPFIIVYLEFQTLLKSCNKTGLKINWLDRLRRIGYKNNLKEYQLSSGGEYWTADIATGPSLSVDDFIQDTYIVDFDRLAELKILPVWLDDLKLAVETNIINEVMFDPTAFNKQLGMYIGGAAVKTQKKNLLILDISGSIPDGIRLTIIQLSKLMSKKFYADIIFTGGSTVFIDYEDVFTKDIKEITDKISRNNEGEQYWKIVKQSKSYGHVIAFGDNDCPNSYMNSTNQVSNFDIENITSLHTENGSSNIVGYAKHLKSKNKPIIVSNWVNSINK